MLLVSDERMRSMRKIKILMLTGFIFLTGEIFNHQTVVAADFSIGVKYWMSAWEISGMPLYFPVNLEISYGGESYSISPHWVYADQMEIEGPGLPGVTALFKPAADWALAVSFLQGNYDFDIDQTFMEEFEGAAAETRIEKRFNVERRDIDITLSYIMTPSVSFFAGLKYLSYSYGRQIKETFTEGSIGPFTQRSQVYPVEFPSYKAEYRGGGAGATFFKVLGNSRFSFFSAVSAMPWFIVSTSGDDRFDDSQGWAATGEAGFGYTLGRLPLSLKLSYKYQKFDGFELKEVDETEDSAYSGAVLAASWMF